MSKEKRRVPKLRFPGFTEDWEQRKLGDYLIQYTEITTQNNQYPVLTSSRKGLFFQTDYYDGNQIASKDNTGYNIVPYGYFTYRHMSDDEIFHFNINYIVDKGIVSTLYPVFTTKNLNSNFLQLQLNYGNEFKEYAVLLKQGGSRTYMYFNKLKNLNLTISTSIDEQEIIAKFFILFEKLITLHQRKLDNLKLKKKALLQKLFPKNGERYPELRFPGFTDAWEQRELDELVDVLDGDRGKNYPKAVDFEVQGHTLFLSASNVTNEGFSFKNNQYITKEKSDSMGNGRLVEDDVIITSRGSLGHVAWYNREIQRLMPHVRINSGMLILRKKVDISMSYLQQFIKSYKGQNQISFISFGSAQPQLTKKDVQKVNIIYPVNLNEQIKIETYFSKLDDLITLHQRKLDHLQLQKKALLQQMFV